MPEQFQGTDKEAVVEFESRRAELVKQGQHPIQATMNISKRNPSLHSAYLRGSQPSPSQTRAAEALLERSGRK